LHPAQAQQKEAVMAVASKLQVKPGQRVRVLNAPADVDLDIEATDDEGAEAVLVFVRNADELRSHEAVVIENASKDRLTWIAYPKAGKLGTDLNRDKLWQLLEDKAIQPVRNVAIDDTWSALRFRPGGGSGSGA
jgi:hypothetical protein